MYRHMVKNLPQGKSFMKLLDFALCGKNQVDFKTHTAFIEACRMSGEMNTSLGNGFCNYMVYLFLHHELGNKDYDCVIEGDDCLGTFSGIIPTAEMYAELGFNVKIEIHDDLSTASFCGLIFCPEDYISIVDPIKVILKTGWTSRKYANCGGRMCKKLLKAKALSNVHQYNGCPIIVTYSLMILRLLGDKIAPNFGEFSLYYHEELLKSMKNGLPDITVPSIHSRMLMETVFNITISEQLVLEDYFDSIQNVRHTISHPIIDDHTTRAQRDYFLQYTVH
jgi:hypothetical protein